MEKKNILITGGGGLIGFALKNLLSGDGEFNVFSYTKNELDTTNINDTDAIFSRVRPDILINCAVSGGRRNDPETDNFLHRNLQGFENIVFLFKKYCSDGLFINFSSGSELDKRFDIFDYSDIPTHKTIPIDCYGLSKYIITNRLRGIDYINSVNLRPFYVFSVNEDKDRFISTCISKAIKNEQIDIWEDKFFGVFYIKDLYILIKFIIEHPYWYSELNCVYPEKTKLSDIAKFIVKETNSSSTINVGKHGLNYTSESSEINYLIDKKLISFYGLESGLKEMILSRQNESRRLYIK